MHRRLAVALALFALTGFAGCKKSSSTSSTEETAGSSEVVTTNVTPHGASSTPQSITSASAAASASKPASAPLPTATESFELVAVGKKFATKIVWLEAHGSRVWLSGMGLDAYADGDGPLVVGPDLLKGLPYDPKKESVVVTGAYPDLFVLRTKRVSGREESPEPAVFIRNGDVWEKSKPITPEWYPDAFVAWNGGALLVNSQIEFNAGPYYSPDRPGTTFTFVAKNGSVSHPSLGIERTFMAWGGSSDGTTLSLIGTRGLVPKHKEEGIIGSSGLVIVRGKDAGSFRSIVLISNFSADMATYLSRVHELGPAAIFVPGMMMNEEEVDGGANTSNLVVITDGKQRVQNFQNGDEGRRIDEAIVTHDVIYAVMHSFGDSVPVSVVRFGADGKRERVSVPMIARKEGGGFRIAKDGDVPFRCDPKHVVLRGADDVWLQAQCGGDDESAAIAAVFRIGHAQDPILLP